MGTDTPPEIDAAVLAFCASISDGVPHYVEVAPAADAEVGYCFDNVATRVALAGGGIAYGWAIWRWPRRYFEAEHHGIWRAPDGRLHDVTPMAFGQRRILFLPDPAAVYDPDDVRSNILAAEPGNAVAAEYVALANARAAIIDAYGEPGIEHELLSAEDQARLAEIEPRWLALYAEMEGE